MNPHVSTAFRALVAIVILLSAPMAAAEVPALRGPASAPVPEAWDYVRLTPRQRYDLRTRARALPEEERAEHGRALRQEIDKLPAWIYGVLHYERAAMDCLNGTFAPLAPPPLLDAWEYVKRVPHQRHDYRLAARALDPESRQKYEAHMAVEMARLPAWLRVALTEEAERQDALYGLEPCPVSTTP